MRGKGGSGGRRKIPLAVRCLDHVMAFSSLQKKKKRKKKLMN